jgi:protein ImuB
MPKPADSGQPAHRSEPVGGRRVVAVVLPELWCELVELTPAPEALLGRVPLGVVLGEPGAEDEIAATSRLEAVNARAHRLGIRPGQTLAQARALVARFEVRRVSRAQLEQGLGRVAEIAFAFGTTVAIDLPDTVWVDVTGGAHLFGGESALVAELGSRVRAIGHRARVALADGPRLAQAFARYGDVDAEGSRVVPSARTQQEIRTLPVRALPLPEETLSWFVRLGVLTFADWNELPKSAVGLRLGAQASAVLELLAGRDSLPLTPYTPPRSLVEKASWEEPVTGSEPLGFALRGLLARLSARLVGRGEATGEVKLTILSDRGIARLRGVPLEQELRFVLAKPLYRENDLRRVIGSRLERTELGAPSVGLCIEASRLIEAMPRQLDLESLLTGSSAAAEDELPLVVAELSADLGEERVGLLNVIDSHRPELRSVLRPVFAAEASPAGAKRGGRSRRGSASSEKRGAGDLKKTRPPLAVKKTQGTGPPFGPPTRLLREPLAFDVPLRVGATLGFDHRLYVIEAVEFEARLEAVEWWSQAISRDYVRVKLRGSSGTIEALVFVDRQTNRRYLQALLD